MILSRRALLPLLLPLPARADQLDPALLMARLASIPERRATFREERSLTALTTPLVSTGRLFYRRPNYLEKFTLWPLPERLTIDGNRLIVFDPASNDPPRVIPLDIDPGLHAFIEAIRAPLAGDLETLRRTFAITAAGTLNAWTLDLSPIGPAAAKVVQHIHLIGQDAWIASIRIAQPNGDVSTLSITPA